MSKFYKRIVNKYINYMIAKDKMKMSDYDSGDLLLIALLDAIANIFYFLFFIFASISIFLFCKHEIIPLM